MIVKPLTTQRPKPWALLTPNYRHLKAQLSDGTTLEARGAERCYQLFTRLATNRTVCYTTGKLIDLRLTTGATMWQADVWRGNATRMKLDGVKLTVSSLRGALRNSRNPFQELEGVMNWLADQGVSPASLSSMSWNLWRSTLTEPFTASFQSKVGHEALYGGRQTATPENYTDMVQVDVAQAYPFAMASAPYAKTLQEVSKLTDLDPNLPGIARATCTIPPDMAHPPLPHRLARSLIRWEWGCVEGTWTWGELAAAKELGASVEVTRCWAPTELVQPFSTWFDLQNEGRCLASGSALVKAMSSSLWGLFGMAADDLATVRWMDKAGENPILVGRPSRFSPHANLAHIAAETSSRVRTRMLLEGLDRHHPAHVDTDGLVMKSSDELPKDFGTKPGQWRVKTSMKSLEIRGPQVYRYRCSEGCGECTQNWHYVTAGVPEHLAVRLFEGVSNVLNVSVMGREYTPESGASGEDPAYLNKWASHVRRTLYGAPLVEV